MTDQIAALACITEGEEGAAREQALDAFYRQWAREPLVMDKWFALQARSESPGTLARVRGLMSHPAYDPRNPNRIRALVGSFCQGNPLRFHASDGSGYAFLRDEVLRLDRQNPQVAARLLGALNRWRKYDAARQALMRATLREILAGPGLSRDVYEVASKALA
jgi:aminopeptidase N